MCNIMEIMFAINMPVILDSFVTNCCYDASIKLLGIMDMLMCSPDFILARLWRRFEVDDMHYCDGYMKWMIRFFKTSVILYPFLHRTGNLSLSPESPAAIVLFMRWICRHMGLIRSQTPVGIWIFFCEIIEACAVKFMLVLYRFDMRFVLLDWVGFVLALK